MDRRSIPHVTGAATRRRIYAQVAATPGVLPASPARALGLARSTVNRSLARLDACGLLLYEDDAGRLYAYRK